MMISTINFLTCLRIALFLIISITPIFGAYSSFEDNRVKCQERERLALLKFKAGLIDDYDRLSTWGNEGDIGEKDCCKWEGILCDNRTNHVVALNLHGPRNETLSPTAPLRGKISPSLLELADLNYLDLSFNDFNKSQIPEFVGSLGKLQSLSMGYSNLGDLIPHSLGNLSMLRHLDLGNNWLHDTDLDWLSGLQSLEYLDLSDNNLKGRNIPNVLGNLTSLSHLNLTNNNLQGRISDVLGNLMSLSHLSLSYNNLEGSIPDALWNLTGLTFLDLSNNQLQGEFLQPSSPNQLNLRLPNLECLDLSMNMLSGRIPNLSSCSSLKRLALNHNMFNGTLTKSIGYLSNVEVVDLSQNHLEGLVSEAHLFNLSKLAYLDLSFNSNLTVRINSSWNPPFQLEGLLLTSCNLGPHFPKWLRKQKQVEVLRISSAEISDTVPDWFWDNNTQTCQELDMSDNQMYGVIPDLSIKLNLRLINLSSNEFNGSLPQLPPAVGSVDLSRNRFSGTIINFCNLRGLYSLDLSDNLLSMEIPQYCFMNLMMSLRYLNLRNNNFFGEVPNSVHDLMICSVYSLHLRNNNFTGEISRSLKNCHNLNILDLGENKFIGNIPSWLGESMPKLSVLSLTSNNLHGSLPSSLCHLQKLQVLDISMNKISGTIPKCLKNLTMLRSKLDSNSIDYWVYERCVDDVYDKAYIIWKGKEAEYVSTLRFLAAIDLSSNNLTGEIPHEVTSLVGLVALNLSRNNLVGSIPGDIDRLELLNFLDFSRNNLSGGIPPSLSQLSHLGVLDLSFNNLSGRIPWNTHLQTFNASVYMGNPGLCGPPLEFKPCPEDEMPRSNVDEMDNLEDEYNIFNSRDFYISMVLGFIVAFWGVFGTLFLNKWCTTTILKMFTNVEDWLYVKILVTKNRLRRYYENC